jgi:hypothetical protein
MSLVYRRIPIASRGVVIITFSGLAGFLIQLFCGGFRPQPPKVALAVWVVRTPVAAAALVQI